MDSSTLYGIVKPDRKPSKKLFWYRTYDGSSILVDYVTCTPSPEEARNAHVVSDFLGKESNGFVDVDECVVAAHSEKPLTTAGLLTCTAMGLVSDTHRLLVHISATCATGPVLFKARGAALNSDTIRQVYLWQGITMMFSLDIAYRMLGMLGIERDDPRIVLRTVSLMDDVHV